MANFNSLLESLSIKDSLEPVQQVGGGSDLVENIKSFVRMKQKKNNKYFK